MSKNVTEEGRTLGALLRLPYERLAERTYSELSVRGYDDIRPAHSAVFRHILPTGSRLTDLAQRAQMAKQSMAYLVDYLHQNDYVHFVPDPVDGRAKLVQLTDRGLDCQRTIMAISRRLENEVASEIGAENMALLRELLERLTTQLEETPAVTNTEKFNKAQQRKDKKQG